MNILVVDDDAGLRDVIREGLQDVTAGRVDTVGDRRAVDLVRLHAYDVILVDMHLGDDLDGSALVEELAAIDPHARFIVMTGLRELDTATSMVRALKGPTVKSYLFKPFSLEELAIEVTRAASAASTAA